MENEENPSGKKRRKFTDIKPFITADIGDSD
jgi:hypothetical protein